MGALTLIGSGLVSAYTRGAKNEKQTAALIAVADAVAEVKKDTTKLRTDFEIGMKENHRENSDKFDRMEANNQRRFDEANAGRLRLGEYIRQELTETRTKLDSVTTKVAESAAAIRSLETSRDEARKR